MSAAWSPGCGTWSLASASANEVEAAATPPSASAPTADGLGVRAVRSSDRGAGPAVAMPLAPVSPARTADGWRTALVRPVETPCRAEHTGGGRAARAGRRARRPAARSHAARSTVARRLGSSGRRRSSRAPGYRPRCPRDRRPRATLPDARGRSAPAAPAAGYGSAAVAPAAPPRRRCRRPPHWRPGSPIRLTLLAGALAAAQAGAWEQVAGFVAAFGLSVLARVAQAPRPFDAAFALAVFSQAWGAFTGTVDAVAGYELVARAIGSLSMAALRYLLLVRLRAVPDLSGKTDIHERTGIFLTATSLGFGVGMLYEVGAWASNGLFDASPYTFGE